jgi:hypothetical protein
MKPPPPSLPKQPQASVWAVPGSRGTNPPESRAGITIFDDHEDLRDPWEMSRVPGACPQLTTANDEATVPHCVPMEPLCEEFSATGVCEGGAQCPYVHGDLCMGCHQFVLHPTDAEVREAHEGPCLQRFVRSQQVEESKQVRGGALLMSARAQVL